MMNKRVRRIARDIPDGEFVPVVSMSRRGLRIVLTEEQHMTLKMAAAAKDQKLANYIREMAVAAAEAEVKAFYEKKFGGTRSTNIERS
jgi:hypothetical protein